MPRVQVLQATPKAGAPDENLAWALEGLAASAADLVVLPELFLSGYSLGPDLGKAALHDGSPRLAALRSAVARAGRSLVLGTPWLDEAGRLRNAALLLTPDGRRARYDKIHLPSFGVFEEGRHFEPGAGVVTAGLPDGTVVGLAICYDAFFPELTKAAATAGADVLVLLSASPEASRPWFERVLPARALETTCWLVFANLVGEQPGARFWGGSRILTPLGETAAAAPVGAPGAAEADLDRAALKAARGRRPHLRDTRLEVRAPRNA